MTRHLFTTTCLLALGMVSAAQAQIGTQPVEASAEMEPEGRLQTVIVTGRAGGSELRKAEASYAITTVDTETLQMTNPFSAADAFKLVPGFWVEDSGGEGSNNVRARGIPTDGYSSVALQENSLSVQYDGGLGYLNADQSFRFDETISRVEAVRGGPASMFAPNAPGGVVNFITRKGTDEPGGLVKGTLSDTGTMRLDAYHGAKLNDNWGYFVGGFYREGDGRRDMGFTAEKGGQIRGTLNYDDGRNTFFLDVKHINDRTPFYLPVPLGYDGNGKITDVAGFDSRKDTLAGPDMNGVGINSADGVFNFDLSEGTRTDLTQLTVGGEYALTDWLSFESMNRYKDADILRNAVFPTGNVVPLSDYLASVQSTVLGAFPTAVEVGAIYASDGTPLTSATNGNGLVVGANLLSVSVPIEEWTTDNRLKATFDAGGQHDLAVGFTYSTYDYRFDRYMGTTLVDVTGNARRVDVVARDADGTTIGQLTDNGFLRYGSIYDNVGMSVDNIALYAGDEWQISPKLRLDIATRWAQTDFTGKVEQKTTVDLGDAFTLADNTALSGTGVYTAVDQTFDDWGWTIGANYQFEDNLGVFARYTDTFRLPSAGEYNGSPTRTDQRSIPIKMAEVGYKQSNGSFDVFATGFYSKFEGVTFTDFVFNTVTNDYESRIVIADTETLGVELEAFWHPTEFFDFNIQATYQDPQYKGFTYTELVNGQPVVRDYDGNQLIRVPKFSVRAAPGVNLLNDRLRAELAIEHHSDRYADVSNSQELPSYTLLHLNMRADLTERLTLGVNVNNLTDELGLTEGNPRAGSFNTGNPTASYFLARPVFGRTLRVSLGYKF